MKKIFSISLLFCAALVFVGCAGEEDDLFNKTAPERLNEASDLYSSRLTAQPNGWAMQLYPTTKDEAPYGNGYLLLLRFNTNHTVVAAMNNSMSSNVFKEDSSAWDVITDNGPVLTFNTYNTVIHTFTNPEDISSTGSKDEPNDETGTGIGGDYEYIITDAPEDASYMMLKGKKRGTYNLLTPVEEGIDYQSYLEDVKNFQNNMFPSNSPTYDIVHYGDSIYKMEGANDGIPNIYPFDKDAVINESFNPFLVTKRGDDYYLRFRDAKTYGDVTVQEFKYISDKDVFESVDNENYYIAGDDPLRFFDSTIGTSYRWVLRANSDMSESVKTIVKNVQTGFTNNPNGKLTFNNASLQFVNGNITLRISYKHGSSQSKVDFVYTYSKQDDGVTFQLEPVSQSSQNTLNSVPALQSLLDLFGQKLTVSAGSTAFNLRTIKLTSAQNPSDWFVLTLN